METGTMEMKIITASEVVINKLIEKTKVDEKFKGYLITSLYKAKILGEQKLAPDLFKALQWPINIPEYAQYLLKFSKWIPKQSDGNACKILEENGYQEIYGRLGHFYFLIDQKILNGHSIILKNIPWFRKWLVDYIKCLGDF